ncbi:MAG: class I SAM-dependent methyltransferase [Nevskiaceae bacterium]
MSRSSFLLPEALAEYYARVALREPELFAELRRETAKLPLAVMQIAPEQGQLMAMLVRLMGAKRCIEVGVFTGYSSLAVASALPDDGELLACDVSAEWCAIARRYWVKAGVHRKIRLVLAPAKQTLDRELEAGRAGAYDFAFIDADKTSYRDYYERCLALLRPGGLVAVDNTLWSGRVADPTVADADTRALREFNAFVGADERVDLCLVPIADGLTLLRKR